MAATHPPPRRRRTLGAVHRRPLEPDRLSAAVSRCSACSTGVVHDARARSHQANPCERPDVPSAYVGAASGIDLQGLARRPSRAERVRVRRTPAAGEDERVHLLRGPLRARTAVPDRRRHGGAAQVRLARLNTGAGGGGRLCAGRRGERDSPEERARKERADDHAPVLRPRPRNPQGPDTTQLSVNRQPADEYGTRMSGYARRNRLQRELSTFVREV